MAMSFERSTRTDALVVALRGVNAEVTYAVLAKQIGTFPEHMKAYLASARRILRKEKIVFGTIRGEGLRRLADLDKVRKSEDNKKRIARSANRALKELDTIEAFDRLANIDQLTVTTNRTIFGLTKLQNQTKPAQQIRAASQPEIPNVEMLRKIVTK